MHFRNQNKNASKVYQPDATKRRGRSWWGSMLVSVGSCDTTVKCTVRNWNRIAFVMDGGEKRVPARGNNINTDPLTCSRKHTRPNVYISLLYTPSQNLTGCWLINFTPYLWQSNTTFNRELSIFFQFHRVKLLPNLSSSCWTTNSKVESQIIDYSCSGHSH